VGRLALAAACVLAVGGCRQLFGIDDTTVGDDAGDAALALDAARADAPPFDGTPVVSPCAASHLRCADFDAPGTGIGQFTPSVVNGGTWAEQVSAVATSPPRVLVAGIPAGSQAATAGGAVPFPAQRHVTARVWIDPPALSIACAPLVFTLFFDLDSGVSVGIGPDRYRIAAFGLGQDPVPVEFGTIGDDMHELVLELDLDENRATASTTSESATLLDPALGAGAQEARYVGVGVSMTQPHGACQVVFDDLVVDAGAP
jgi:hypothetical protein